MRLFALFVGLIGFTACATTAKDLPPQETGTACTDLAAASGDVKIVNSTGYDLEISDLTYTVDGGAVETATCADEGAPPCAEWITGWEEAGHFVITAGYLANADGGCSYVDSVTAEFDVPLDGTGCHVVEQHATMELKTDHKVCP